MKRIVKNNRALSPVIATVILISVTLVVAVSVAYWMGGIAGGYTSFEQLELPSVYARWNEAASNWTVTIELKNTGSADSTVNNIFINSIPLKDYGGDATLSDGVANYTSTFTVSLYNGQSKTFYLYLNPDSVSGENNGFSSGTRIILKVQTAAGQDYPTQVRLP